MGKSWIKKGIRLREVSDNPWPHLKDVMHLSVLKIGLKMLVFLCTSWHQGNDWASSITGKSRTWKLATFQNLGWIFDLWYGTIDKWPMPPLFLSLYLNSNFKNSFCCCFIFILIPLLTALMKCTWNMPFSWMIMLSAENQKGINSEQRYSVESWEPEGRYRCTMSMANWQ